MDKIKIDKLRDIIIVEKSEGNKVFKGSKFFCGCCGKTLGEAKEELNFPSDSKKFKKSLNDISFEVSRLGMRHKKCGHSMFTFKKTYGFIPLENYNKQIDDRDGI